MPEVPRLIVTDPSRTLPVPIAPIMLSPPPIDTGSPAGSPNSSAILSLSRPIAWLSVLTSGRHSHRQHCDPEAAASAHRCFLCSGGRHNPALPHHTRAPKIPPRPTRLNVTAVVGQSDVFLLNHFIYGILFKRQPIFLFFELRRTHAKQCLDICRHTTNEESIVDSFK